MRTDGRSSKQRRKVLSEMMKTRNPMRLKVLCERQRQRMLGKKGVNSVRYIDGRTTYRKFKGNKCFDCGSIKNLIVHHKDENRKNNVRSNLRTVCAKCHCNIYHLRQFHGNQYTKKN